MIVIVEVPDWPLAGTIVKVRFAPDPPNVMLAFGTTVVLLEVAATVSAVVALSASAIVKATLLRVVFEFVAWSAIAPTVGEAEAQRIATVPLEPVVLASPPLPELATAAAAAAGPRPTPPFAYVTLDPVKLLALPVGVPPLPPPEPPTRVVPVEPEAPFEPCPAVPAPPVPAVPL
ncbi:MAG: hypothetical protein ACKOSO_09980 [Actinomycetota bacterium]